MNSDAQRRPPHPGLSAAPIGELLGEREVAGGWHYDAQIVFADGSMRRLAITLSWSDYQHWSPDGATAPSQIADAVLRVVASSIERFAGMESIDASTARRRVERGDEIIRATLRRE